MLTIHTATYNRGDILERVYRSLQRQSCYDFEWLITDDGSEDNTREQVDRWISEEQKFAIRYIHLEHGGLIRAVNKAIEIAEGDYYFRLDSDDFLLPHAVETIVKRIPEIEEESDIVGVGFVKVTKSGMPVKGVWPKVNEAGYVDCTNLERENFDLDADMCEAYKIGIIRQYNFPVWEGEMFAPEQLQMDAMALEGYKVRWYSQGIYVCEYQADGLTKGSWNLNRNNPMGFAMLANQRLLYSKGKVKYKAAAEHIALSIVGKNPGYILKTNAPLTTMAALPLGIILAIRRHNQYKWDDPVNRRNTT